MNLRAFDYLIISLLITLPDLLHNNKLACIISGDKFCRLFKLLEFSQTVDRSEIPDCWRAETFSDPSEVFSQHSNPYLAQSMPLCSLWRSYAGLSVTSQVPALLRCTQVGTRLLYSPEQNCVKVGRLLLWCSTETFHSRHSQHSLLPQSTEIFNNTADGSY